MQPTLVPRGADGRRWGHLRDVRDIQTSVQNLFQAVLSHHFSTPNRWLAHRRRVDVEFSGKPCRRRSQPADCL